MPEQRVVTQMGGTMRLGEYPCELEADSKARAAYGVPSIGERHRHRFEFNNDYREAFESVGLWPTGLSPNRKLVEIMELEADKHPFMLGVQFHPGVQVASEQTAPALQGVCHRGEGHPARGWTTLSATGWDEAGQRCKGDGMSELRRGSAGLDSNQQNRALR